MFRIAGEAPTFDGIEHCSFWSVGVVKVGEFRVWSSGIELGALEFWGLDRSFRRSERDVQG